MLSCFIGLTRLAPLIIARTFFRHKLDRHIVSSVRAEWEQSRRQLHVPHHILNLLLALDTAISTENFLYLSSGGPLPDCESLELEEQL